MTATSVLGVGSGSAEKAGMKGPGKGRNTYVPLVSPHVVAAGTVTLSSGDGTVTFPAPLAQSATKYVVMLTPIAAAGASHEVSVVSKNDVSSKFANFVVKGAGTSDVVMYTVISTGFGA